jgi:hypothetical protein
MDVNRGQWNNPWANLALELLYVLQGQNEKILSTGRARPWIFLPASHSRDRWANWQAGPKMTLMRKAAT